MKRIVAVLVMCLVTAAVGCTDVHVGQAEPEIGPAPVSTDPVVIEMSAVDAAPRTKGAGGEEAQFIDVRSEAEYGAGHAEGADNIPLDRFEESLDRIDKNKQIYLICQSGRRSMEAGKILTANGYRRVFSIEGGTPAWEAAGLPMDGK